MTTDAQFEKLLIYCGGLIVVGAFIVGFLIGYVFAYKQARRFWDPRRKLKNNQSSDYVTPSKEWPKI